MGKTWDNIWNNDIYSREDTRRKRAQNKLKCFHELGVNFYLFKSVADFGSGAGYVSQELLHRYPHIQRIDLYDSSKTALEMAKARLPRNSKNTTIGFYERDLNYPFSHIRGDAGKYDLIISFGVLEHLDNIQQGIDNIYHALSPTGEALLVWSNKNSIFYKQHCVFEKIGIWRYGITKELHQEQVEELFNGKFSIIKCIIVPCFVSVNSGGVLTTQPPAPMSRG